MTDDAATILPPQPRRRRLLGSAILAAAISTAIACAPPPQTANPMGYVGEYPSARIVDGDTIDVTTLPSDNIRFIGIDTPEVGTPCGPPATEHLRALIAGRGVTLVAALGREDHDGYVGPSAMSRSPAWTSDGR